MPSTRFAKISCVRNTDGIVGRPPTGKKPYTAKMTPAVREALDTFASSIGSNRSDVIEALVREKLGLPTINSVPLPSKPAHRKSRK